MEYIVVSVEGKGAFEDKVQSMIDNGWKPQGGVSVTQQKDSIYIYYHQAMTKK